MFTSPFWIPDAPLGRLATSTWPAPQEWLYDDVAAWKDEGADIVVSLFSDREVQHLGLDAEQEHCRDLGIEFRRFPISDHGIPDSVDSFLELINRLHEVSGQNRGIVAHCYAVNALAVRLTTSGTDGSDTLWPPVVHDADRLAGFALHDADEDHFPGVRRRWCVNPPLRLTALQVQYPQIFVGILKIGLGKEQRPPVGADVACTR